MASLPESIVVRMLVPGEADGEVLCLDEPLSLWGGLDPKTGTIIDRRHPQCGEDVRGKLVAMTCGRGSSSASSILLESVRRGTAPAAFLLAEVDGILALGATVARDLYGRAPAIAVVPSELWPTLETGAPARLEGDRLRVE